MPNNLVSIIIELKLIQLDSYLNILRIFLWCLCH